MNRRLVVVIGATGVGKSKLGIQLAKALGGEVVNADAIQMYKGLDVATAKVTLEEMEGVPHHMLGFLSATDTFTVRAFRNKALPIIRDISNRGKVPIIVGGTLYYIQSLLWPSLLDETPTCSSPDATPGEEGKSYVKSEQYLSKGNHPLVISPLADPEVCAEILRAREENDTGKLYEIMERIDPKAGQSLHPSDFRKVNAALETYLCTGSARSVLYKRQREANTAQELRFYANIIWLRCQPDEHFKRLGARVNSMMQQGLWEEARDFILDHEQGISRIMEGQQQQLQQVQQKQQHQQQDSDDANLSGIFQAIGYKEFWPAFSKAKELGLLKGSSTSSIDMKTKSATELEQAIDDCAQVLKIKHRQYARKQLQWINKRVLPRNAPVHALDTTLYDSLQGTERTEWWEKQVLSPALELCRWFSSQVNVQAPSASATALEAKALTPKELESLASDPPGDDDQTWRSRANKQESDSNSAAGRDLEKFECLICNKIMIGRDVWEKHVGSNKHKSNVKRDRQKLFPPVNQLRIKRTKQEKKEQDPDQDQDQEKEKLLH